MLKVSFSFKPKGRPLKRWFSLTELLIVISLLSILLMLLMPSLNKIILLQEQLQCAQSENKLGIAVFLFCEDYENYLPAESFSIKNDAFADQLFPSSEGISASKAARSWDKAHSSNNFWPYVMTNLWPVCPSHQLKSIVEDNIKSKLWYKNGSTYLMSGTYFSKAAYESNTYIVRKSNLTSIFQPSQLFMFLESRDDQSTSVFRSIDASYNYAKFGIGMGRPHAMGTGLNALYFDGHVSFQEMYDEPIWSKDYKKLEDGTWTPNLRGFSLDNWVNE